MNQKNLPKFQETFIPILDILRDGETISVSTLTNKVIEGHYSDLDKEELEKKTKNGAPVLFSRIHWGKTYLKQAGMVDQPSRGKVKITEKGKHVLNEKHSLELQEVLKDPTFLKKRKQAEIKKESIERVNETESTPQDLIDTGLSLIEKQTKLELFSLLENVDPYYFEKIILKLLQSMGYGDFIETKKSNDGGVDGIINQDELGIDKIYIQAKRYKDNKVRETDIRNFIGAMSGDTQKGVFVTTSTFDEKAMQKAKEAHHIIILIDGSRLIDLMYKFGIGVQTTDTYVLKEVDEDFFEDV